MYKPPQKPYRNPEKQLGIWEGWFLSLGYWVDKSDEKNTHFGVEIVWGAIPSGLPVFRIIVYGRSRNSYGTSPNLWVQKKPIKLRQGTQDTWLCFAKFFREFLGYSPIDLLGEWEL